MYTGTMRCSGSQSVHIELLSQTNFNFQWIKMKREVSRRRVNEFLNKTYVMVLKGTV